MRNQSDIDSWRHATRTYNIIPGGRRDQSRWQRILRDAAMFIAGAAVMFLIRAAEGRDLTITDQQQQAIYVICEKAARSPSNSLDELVDIGLFCRNWRELTTRNNTVVPVPKPPDAPQDSEK